MTSSLRLMSWPTVMRAIGFPGPRPGWCRCGCVQAEGPLGQPLDLAPEDALEIVQGLEADDRQEGRRDVLDPLAGQEERDDVGLGQRRLGGERRRQVVRRAEDLELDEIPRDAGLGRQVQVGDDPVRVGEGRGRLDDLIRVPGEMDLAAVDDADPALEARLVRGTGELQLAFDAGLDEVVVEPDRLGGLEPQREGQVLEEGVPLGQDVAPALVLQELEKARLDAERLPVGRGEDVDIAAEPVPRAVRGEAEPRGDDGPEVRGDVHAVGGQVQLGLLEAELLERDLAADLDLAAVEVAAQAAEDGPPRLNADLACQAVEKELGFGQLEPDLAKAQRSFDRGVSGRPVRPQVEEASSGDADAGDERLQNPQVEIAGESDRRNAPAREVPLSRDSDRVPSTDKGQPADRELAGVQASRRAPRA
jgi:hypothetical protein